MSGPSDDPSPAAQYELDLAAAGLTAAGPLRPETSFRPPARVTGDESLLGSQDEFPYYAVFVPGKPRFQAPWKPAPGSRMVQVRPGVDVVPAELEVPSSGDTVNPVPPPGRGQPTADEMRQRLAARQRRWASLSPVATRVIRYEGTFGWQHDAFNGGAMWKKTPMPGVNSTYFPLPSATNPDLDAPRLRAKRLKPSFPDGKGWIDPEQDLLVSTGKFKPLNLVLFFDDGVIERNYAINAIVFLLDTVSNVPHPRAANHKLVTPPPPPLFQLHDDERDIKLNTVQVLGDTLAALVTYGSGKRLGTTIPVLYMWDWPTGKLFGELVGHRGNYGSEALTLLSPRTALLANPTCLAGDGTSAIRTPPTLTLWTFPVSPPFADTPHPGLCVAQLDLPPIAPTVYAAELHLTPPRTGPASRAMGGGDGTPSQTHGVVRLSIAHLATPLLTTPPPPPHGAFEIFILRESLLSLIADAEQRTAGLPAPPTFPLPKAGDACAVPGCTCIGVLGSFHPTAPCDGWSAEDEHGRTFWSNEDDAVCRRYEWVAWGQDNARVLPRALLASGMRRVFSTCGYRDAALRPRRAGAPPMDLEEHWSISVGGRTQVAGFELEILDFSPRTVAQALGTHAQEVYEVVPGVLALVDAEQHTIPAGGLWAGEVVSKLPFVRTRREVVLPFDGQETPVKWVLLDEQRVLYGASCAVGMRLQTPDGRVMRVYATELVVLCM